jgi:hypothetical protein
MTAQTPERRQSVTKPGGNVNHLFSMRDIDCGNAPGVSGVTLELRNLSGVDSKHTADTAGQCFSGKR